MRGSAPAVGQLIIRFAGGPWHALTWTPANPAGVLAVLRVAGWGGSYRRYRIDHAARWIYQWEPDSANAP